MKTRGQLFLEKSGVPFELHWYDHREKGAAFAAESTGIPVANMIKTLVVTNENRSNFAFVLMPGDKELDLKTAARSLGWRKGRMATPQEAERLTGYLVGGISPFGANRQLPVLIHDGWPPHTPVGINGGARGCIAKLDVSSIIQLLRPIQTDLSRCPSSQP